MYGGCCVNSRALETAYWLRPRKPTFDMLGIGACDCAWVELRMWDGPPEIGRLEMGNCSHFEAAAEDGPPEIGLPEISFTSEIAIADHTSLPVDIL